MDLEPPTPGPGSEEHFVSLLTSHHDRLLRFVKSLVPNDADAEDVFQRATVVLWQKHSDYDPERPFFPWACRFLHFEVLNYRKRAARDRLTFSEELVELLATDHIHQQSILDARKKALDTCITRLSDQEQSLLRRRYEEQGKVIDLASDLNLTPKRLYKTLEVIRRKLALCIDRALLAKP